jgi:uroporphyrinogen-III synthase
MGFKFSPARCRVPPNRRASTVNWRQAATNRSFVMQENISELKEKSSETCEVDFLHRIAEHVAKGDTFDETLASAIDFAVRLVSCNGCVAYVRDGEQFVPWVWKYSEDKSVEQSRLAFDHVYVRALSERLQPIAVAPGIATDPQAREFSAWSTRPGETSVWIPLAARSELHGVLHLEHQNPHLYSGREINLLSGLGRILGADIRISQLKGENSDLLLQLETRKFVERGKGILQRDFGMSEQEAYLALQRQSRQKRCSMKEIARAIILSDEVRQSSLQTE